MEMSLACQRPQQVQCISGVPCPSMCGVGGIFLPSSSQLSPSFLPVDINKNRTAGDLWSKEDKLLGDCERLERCWFKFLCGYLRPLEHNCKSF